MTIDEKAVTLVHGNRYVYVFEHMDVLPEIAWMKIGSSTDICNRWSTYSQIAMRPVFHRCYEVHHDVPLAKVEHRLHDHLMKTTKVLRRDEKFIYGNIMTREEVLSVCDQFMDQYLMLPKMIRPVETAPSLTN